MKQNIENSIPVYSRDHESLLRKLRPKQRKVLILFREYDVIVAKQIGELFDVRGLARSQLCARWVDEGFLVAIDSLKGRKYSLGNRLDSSAATRNV